MTHQKMNTETQVSPVAETQNQATEVVEKQEVTTPDVEATPEQKAEEEHSKALKAMEKRIDRLTAKSYRTAAENQQLRETIARFEQQSQQTETQDEAKPLSREEIARLVKEEAKVLTKQERINEKANTIHAEGVKKFPDFDTTIAALGREVDLFTKQGPTPLMEAVLDSESPAELLHHLGKDPDLAAELAELSPTQIARRLVKIESELIETKKPKTSQAPKPLTPVKASSGSDEPDINDAKAWIAWSNKRDAERLKR